MKIYRTYQFVDNEIRYTEDYEVGNGANFENYEDLTEALDEQIGLTIDRYEIEELI